jgi:hypothetical protein
VAIASSLLAVLGIAGSIHFELGLTIHILLVYLIVLLVMAGMSLEKELWKRPFSAEIDIMQSSVDFSQAVPGRLDVCLYTEFYNEASHPIYLQAISIYAVNGGWFRRGKISKEQSIYSIESPGPPLQRCKVRGLAFNARLKSSPYHIEALLNLPKDADKGRPNVIIKVAVKNQAVQIIRLVPHWDTSIHSDDLSDLVKIKRIEYCN